MLFLIDPKTKKPLDPYTKKPIGKFIIFKFLDPKKLPPPTKKKKKKEAKFITPDWAMTEADLDAKIKELVNLV